MLGRVHEFVVAHRLAAFGVQRNIHFVVRFGLKLKLHARHLS